MLSSEEVVKLMAKSPKLQVQNYDQVDKINPDSICVKSRQATINIGTIGHVAHGKSTVVRAISGVNTIRHRKERIKNITIKLGYGNAKIYKCPECPAPSCYKSFGSAKEDESNCEECKKPLELLRHISFVDCPGHDILMATMLTGAAIMDAALLLISAEIKCPQPQTSEHLAAVQIMQLDRIIILQNKIDLIFQKKGFAKKNYDQIKEFVKGTIAENSPIIPISAQFRYNIEAVIQYIAEYIPIPQRDFTSSPMMIVIRSFDINRPGYTIDQMKGGIAGGSILNGVLKVGDEIELRPGIISKDPNTGQKTCTPIHTQIISLFAENNSLLYAIPGGLIAVGTQMDPCLTKANELVGNIIGYPGRLPDVYDELEIEYYLLRRLVGVRSEQGDFSEISKLMKKEVLMINVGSTSCGGRVISTVSKTSVAKIALLTPVCTKVGEKIALSRKIQKNWRLIGWGNIKAGKVIYSNNKENN